MGGTMRELSQQDAYWSRSAEQLLGELASGPTGLSAAEARTRLRRYGPNALREQPRSAALWQFLVQLKSPLVLILLFAAGVSASVGEWIDAAIIVAIVLGSAALSFAQEYRASSAVARLRARVTAQATLLRGGQPASVPVSEVVPGDVALLAAGSRVPADGVLLEANACLVDQAVLTGESFPAEKRPGVTPEHASLSKRSNCLFQGASLRSGTARMLVVETGPRTMFGQIAGRLALRPPETEFERGIHRFGAMLTQVMLALVLGVFAINVFAHKPPIDSLLFAIALAVGISPELLPAIISITLARGAQEMARHGVIVRRLNAIENFGSIDVLCTDKTGTLTEGAVRLEQATDPQGRPAPRVLRAALLNAHLQTGLVSPLDAAIADAAAQQGLGLAGASKLGEIPYDFERKRLGVVVQAGDESPQLIVKGAFAHVLAACSRVAAGAPATVVTDEKPSGSGHHDDRRPTTDDRHVFGGRSSVVRQTSYEPSPDATCISGQAASQLVAVPLGPAERAELEQRFGEWSAAGLRVLGLAARPIEARAQYRPADERELTLLGFLLFCDPPKPGAARAIGDLAALGVQIKLITGDNRPVAMHTAQAVGLPVAGVLSGAELSALSDEALWQRAERTSLFVDVDPNQKERIILALRKTGHVVGYMGDGINDAPALHAADVGISVDTAVDVAKDAADFVLLEQDLGVLRRGIEQGRSTFANTLKYVFTTTSANFGNMLSMAGASLFLPFLPLLAKQILLNNFLSDLPGAAIASDNVDREWVERPQRWDIGFIRRFMAIFGLLSSLFDYLTFGALWLLTRGDAVLFRTGWFVESLLTELAVALVVRTRQPCFRSRPGRLLWISTLAVALATLALPYLPSDRLFGFTPLPAPIMGLLIGITGLYVLAAELTKRWFYRRFT